MRQGLNQRFLRFRSFSEFFAEITENGVVKSIYAKADVDPGCLKEGKILDTALKKKYGEGDNSDIEPFIYKLLNITNPIITYIRKNERIIISYCVSDYYDSGDIFASYLLVHYTDLSIDYHPVLDKPLDTTGL